MREALQEERGLMIDIGRKFYSVSFLKNLIEYMAELSMTHLQLHFSENEGFRIECETVPQIISKDYLTKDEIRNLISYGKQVGIEIIPSFDSPGHLFRLLEIYPLWKVEVEESDSQIFPSNRALDITNAEAVRTVKNIVKEYLELFEESSYFHLGADEYIDFDNLKNYPNDNLKNYPNLLELARERYEDEDKIYQVIMDYINDLSRLVKFYGKTARIWNDGIYRKNLDPSICLDSDIEITYWTNYNSNMADINSFVERGHKILNFNDNYFYFVLGEAASYSYPTAQKIADEWNPNLFSGKQVLDNQYMNQVKGTYFAIWSDIADALSEDQVFQLIKEPLRAQQEKLWI